MINNLFIKLDYNKYNTLLNYEEIKKNLIKNKNITGNKLFKIFDISNNLLTANKYIKYSNLNFNPNNHIFIYENTYYISKKLDATLNTILNSNNTIFYNKFLISKFINNTNDIYYSINTLDLNMFEIIYKTNYLQLFYNKENKPFLPINHCNYLIKQYTNKIALDILYIMFNKLKELNYSNFIDPIFFDLENKKDYNNSLTYININTIIDGLYFYDNNFEIISKYITYFNLNYKNEKFIFFINNTKNIDNILNNININKNINIYDYYILLLCINKINIFNEIILKDKNKNIIDNILIYEPNLLNYLITYNCKISFYYLIEQKNNIIINTKLPSEFFKIYLNLLQIHNSLNLFDYINLYDNLLTTDEIKLIINNKYFDNTFKIKYINKLIFDRKNNDYLFNLIKTKYKNLFYTSDILINIINQKNEELFIYLLNNSNEYEKDYILTKVKDKKNNEDNNEENTISHLICKNNICLGLKINNNLINKNGFKPLDLCIINKTFYE